MHAPRASWLLHCGLLYTLLPAVFGQTIEEANLRAVEICSEKLSFDNETLQEVISNPPSEENEYSRCFIECVMQSLDMLVDEELNLPRLEEYLTSALEEAGQDIGPDLTAQLLRDAKSCGSRTTKGAGKCVTGFQIWKCIFELTLPHFMNGAPPPMQFGRM